MANTTTTKTFYFFNHANRLIVGGIELGSFEEARKMAREMNKEGAHSTLGYVEFISDANPMTHGCITTVSAPSQSWLSLPDVVLPEPAR